MIKIKRMAFLLILFAVVAGIIFLFTKDNEETVAEKVGLYFFDSSGTAIELVESEIEADSTKRYLAVAQKLIDGPSDSKNLPILKKEIKVNSAVLTDGDLTVDFTEEICDESITSLYAVIKTYSRFSEVKRVRITANGMDILKEDGEALGFVLGEEINLESDDDFSTRITLYFANEDKTALVKESRKITITDTQPKEEYILSELMKGPKNIKNKKLLAGDNEILSTETTDGTCYVNLKKPFLGASKTATNEDILAIYSIVNSLTELEGVKNVKFLVAGKTTDAFDNIKDGELFIRNDSLIQK